MEKIVSVACEYNGLIFSLPMPARHGDVMILMNEWNFDMTPLANQGFLTNLGRYVDRKTAKTIAIEAKQVTANNFNELYSEELW